MHGVRANAVVGERPITSAGHDVEYPCLKQVPDVIKTTYPFATNDRRIRLDRLLLHGHIL